MPVTLADLRRKRDQILRLADRYRVRNVRVFGSVVRGDLEPWSDVDFIVDPLPGHSLFDRAALVVALSELLGTEVDVASESELREFVRARARAEAVAL
jgi:predicted nucleotidyltransferase